MPFVIHTRQEILKRESRFDDADLFDRVRGEVSALGGGLRWVIERRIATLLEPLGVNDERISAALQSLISMGDVVVGPGNVIGRSPLRAIRTGTDWIIVGSDSTASLRESMPDMVAGL